MHEFSITTNLVNTVLEEAKKRRAKKVLDVRLIIGNLTFLGLEQVKFSYQILVRDTMLEGSKLFIERQEGIVECDDCDYKGEIRYKEDQTYHFTIPSFSCPRCGCAVRVVGGKECLIKSIKAVI